MTETTTTIALPEGITAIERYDLGMGPALCVKFANGWSLTIDALGLTSYDAQVALHEPGANPVEDVTEVIASLSFGCAPRRGVRREPSAQDVEAIVDASVRVIRFND